MVVLAAPGDANSSSNPSGGNVNGNNYSPNSATNSTNTKQPTPGLSQQGDSANYFGCYKNDYTPVSNLDQQKCEGADYNWVSDAGANIGTGCKDNDSCKEAVNKARKERDKKKAQSEINQRKQKLTSACSVTSKATDCWNFSGDGTEYTQSSGTGSGTWSTLSQMYSDCRITTDKNMGDALSDGNKDLTTLVGKNFRCKAKGTDDWYECSIKTTNAHDTAEHVEFTCPTSSEIKNGLAHPMSDAQIKSMDSENKSAYGDDNDDDTCEQSLFGLGWILCPLKELIVGGIDGFMTWISDKLDAQILIGSSGSTVKGVAQNFITYGNIILTIVFIVMIYSMATSTGMSNYNIKTILPRLVIVAIAINLSFYICAALVDISNIAGHGMYSLLCSGDGCKAMQSQTTIHSESSILGDGVNMMMAILCLVLFGGGAIISFLIIIICLEFREIALAIMTIIAPVAIALYLLPNTQNWAQRWFKLYTQLLLVYPLFTGMLGGAQLIGSLIMADNTTGIPDFLIALGCDIAPAIGVVPLFRVSGGLIDKVAGTAQKYTQPFGDAIGSGARSLAKNNPLTRGGARMVGAGAGAIASRRNGRGFIGRKAGMVSNTLQTFGRSTNTEEAKVRSEAASRSDSAIDERLANGRIDSRDLIGAEMIANRDVNMSRAAIRRAGKDKTIQIGDQRALMAAVATRASQLQQQGRNADARALLDDTANAIGDNYMGDQRSMEAFRNGQWGNNGANIYDSAINNTTAAMNATQTSKQTEQQLQERVRALNNQQSGNANRARSNMSQNVQQISADKKLQSNMDNNATQVLQGNFGNAWAIGQAANGPAAAAKQDNTTTTTQQQTNNQGQPLPQHTVQGGITYTLGGNGLYMPPGKLEIKK